MSAALNNATPDVLTRLQTAFAAHPEHTSLVRRRAFDAFMRQGFPTVHDEDWKYTTLRRLESRPFVLACHDGQPMAADANELQLQFINGLCRTNVEQLLLPNGLRIRPLHALPAPERDALLSDNQDAHRFAALNAALSQDGVLIETDANVIITKPVFLQFGWQGTDSHMAHPRIVIKASKHSRLTVIEHYQDAGATAHWHNSVTHIDLAEGAQLEHDRVQVENSTSFHLGLVQAHVAAHGKLISHHIHFGAALGRVDIDVRLQGAESEVVLNGLQFASGTQHHDTHTVVEHAVPHTRSVEDYRGIADQRGRVVFNGKVIVAKGARKTDAAQSSRNLLLARTAEIDTKPELEIHNDDVKCAHGATVGQLDANALFYLRSRGLSEAQARALLTHAFADHIIRQLPLESLQLQLTAASHARFGAQLEALS